MITTNEIIGRNILETLDAKGMKQIDLAERLGLTKQTINKILHGRKNISAQELKDISDALGVSMESLTKEAVAREEIEPIKLFMGEVRTKEARVGLAHAQKIMDLILFHSELQVNKSILSKE